jgi:hypothetical protein
MDGPPALGFVPAAAVFEMTQVTRARALTPIVMEAIVEGVAQEFAKLAECPVRGVFVGVGGSGPIGMLVFPRDRAEQFAAACAEEGLALVRGGLAAAPSGVDVTANVAAACGGAQVAAEDLYLMQDRASDATRRAAGEPVPD